MGARNGANHSPIELRYLDACDRTNIVHFTAASASTPGKVNSVGLDVLTGETHCSCRAAETGHACWHQRLVSAAWESSPAMQEVRWLNDDRLARYGRKAANMIETYRHRCGRALPMDMLNLVAARAEYRRRQRAATAEEPMAA
jgi:hypothetical protein